MVDDTELTAALAVDLDAGFADVVRVHQRTGKSPPPPTGQDLPKTRSSR